MLNKIWSNFKLEIKLLLSRIPQKLPVGMTEFHKFADEIIELSGAFADVDSMKFAIATMILHAESKAGYLSKHYFVLRLRKTAANQVAGQVFQDIKEKQQAAQAAQSAEATALKAVVDVSPK